MRPPQPSLISPQLTPRSAQLVGTQLTHSLFTHCSPGAQVPHSTRAPVQACVIAPQFLPCATHSAGGGVGRQTPCVQVSLAEQPPPPVLQSSVPPQPSLMVPHSAP